MDDSNVFECKCSAKIKNSLVKEAINNIFRVNYLFFTSVFVGNG